MCLGYSNGIKFRGKRLTYPQRLRCQSRPNRHYRKHKKGRSQLYVLRLLFLYQLFLTLSDELIIFPDTLLTPYTFSTLEPFLAILCSCLPTYGPLLPTRNYAKSLHKRFGSDNTGNYSGEGDSSQWRKEEHEMEHKGKNAHTRAISGRTGSDTWRTENTAVEEGRDLESDGMDHRWDREQRGIGTAP